MREKKKYLYRYEEVEEKKKLLIKAVFELRCRQKLEKKRLRCLLDARGLAGHVDVGRVERNDVAVLVRHGRRVGVDRVLDVGLAADKGWRGLASERSERETNNKRQPSDKIERAERERKEGRENIPWCSSCDTARATEMRAAMQREYFMMTVVGGGFAGLARGRNGGKRKARE